MKDFVTILGIIVFAVLGTIGIIRYSKYLDKNYTYKIESVYDENGDFSGYDVIYFKIEDCDVCELKPIVNYETMINKGLEKPEFIFKVVGISKSFKRSTGERIITHFDLGQGPI